MSPQLQPTVEYLHTATTIELTSDVHSFPHSKVALVPHGDEDHVARGERIAATELPDGGNPWLSGASMFRDDPLFDDWQRAIANYRREANESADAP